MPLTCTALAPMGCDTPNCGHDHTILHLHPGCHPRAGLALAYDKRDGVLTVTCAKCEEPVAKLQLAA